MPASHRTVIGWRISSVDVSRVVIGLGPESAAVIRAMGGLPLRFVMRLCVCVRVCVSVCVLLSSMFGWSLIYIPSNCASIVPHGRPVSENISQLCRRLEPPDWSKTVLDVSYWLFSHDAHVIVIFAPIIIDTIYRIYLKMTVFCA